jgi:hypothetical protein
MNHVHEWVTRYFTDGISFLKWRTCRTCGRITGTERDE